MSTLQNTKPPSRLSIINLLKQIRSAFDEIADQRTNRKTITLSDALMSGLAMFWVYVVSCGMGLKGAKGGAGKWVSFPATR